MFNFNDNRKTVNEIFTMFDEGKLIVDDTYQRRSVWSEKDKVRLIETILLQLVIPELFFWKADTDPETGISTTHIVDGQQRIKAIYSFINNEFKLKPQYLLDESSKEKYANKYFKDLCTETRKTFWNYQLMIIEIDSTATRDDIITMFNRLNLTDYNLNDQEKRNSVSGEFYTLFSVVFYMQRENIAVEQYQKTRLEYFVKLYSVFNNDMDLTGEISDQEKILFDWLKKYKLASSEGLNKHTNRMIRYNVMKDFLFGLTDELEAAQSTLYEKMQANSTDTVEEDPKD